MSQQSERKEAQKMMEEDLIIKWHEWGKTPKEILQSGQSILAHYNTETKIKKVIKRNFS